MSKTITLWPYQPPVVDAVTTSDDDFLIEHPTGSGKTVMLVAITSLLLQKGFRLLIAAPQEHIEENFTQRCYDAVRCSSLVLPAPPDMIRAARNKKSATKEVSAYLDDPGRDYALACTHAALARIIPSGISPALAKCVLAIDEAHHSSATGLSQFVTAWKRGGGRALFLTATGFRHDDAEVLLAGMRVVRRSLPQHMEEGYAPARIESAIVAASVDDKVGLHQFQGEETPSEKAQAIIIAKMIEAWTRDDRPKTVVRVPPLRGGTAAFVQRICAAFVAVGARVLDATGTAITAQSLFLQELRKERGAASYASSCYDVVIGIQRVAEGMDWPLCSDVYCVGLPASLPFVIQLLGRATRRKHQEGYPPQLASRAKLSFFVPTSDGDTLSKLPVHHCRKALLVCSFLANSQTSYEWAAVRFIGRGVAVHLGKPEAEAAAEVEAALPYIDPKYKEEARLAVGQAELCLMAAQVSPTPGNKLEWVLRNSPDVNPAVVKQYLVEQIVASDGIAPDKARAVLLAGIRERLTGGSDLKAAIIGAFDEVLQEFRESAVVASKSTALLEEQIIALTGSQITHFAGRLAEARPLSPSWLLEAVRKHKDATGTWPSGLTAGGPEGWPGESWAIIDTAVRTGVRGWPLLAARSLSDFARHYGPQGSAGDVIGKMADRFGWNDPRRAFIDHLLDGEVRLAMPGRSGNIRLRDIPVPCREVHGGVSSSTLQLHAQVWHQRFRDAQWWDTCGPLGILWSYEVLEAVESYLRHGGIAMGTPQAEALSVPLLITSGPIRKKVTDATKNWAVRFVVPPGKSWEVTAECNLPTSGKEKFRLEPGDEGVFIMLRCGHSEEAPGLAGFNIAADLEDAAGGPPVEEGKKWLWDNWPSFAPAVAGRMFFRHSAKRPDPAPPQKHLMSPPPPWGAAMEESCHIMARLPLEWITSFVKRFDSDELPTVPDWPTALASLGKNSGPYSWPQNHG